MKRVKAGPGLAPLSKTAPPSPKSGPAKRISILKIARPKANPGPQGTSEIELALAKPVGVSKKFRVLDVVCSSHRLHAVGVTLIRATRVPAFNNLGVDSFPDVCRTPSPAKMVEKRASPPPSVSGEFLHFSFALLPWALITILHMLAGFHPRWICHWRI
jgi:hypothetical protein